MQTGLFKELLNSQVKGQAYSIPRFIRPDSEMSCFSVICVQCDMWTTLKELLLLSDDWNGYGPDDMLHKLIQNRWARKCPETFWVRSSAFPDPKSGPVPPCKWTLIRTGFADTLCLCFLQQLVLVPFPVGPKFFPPTQKSFHSKSRRCAWAAIICLRESCQAAEKQMIRSRKLG